MNQPVSSFSPPQVCSGLQCSDFLEHWGPFVYCILEFLVMLGSDVIFFFVYLRFVSVYN